MESFVWVIFGVLAILFGWTMGVVALVVRVFDITQYRVWYYVVACLLTAAFLGGFLGEFRGSSRLLSSLYTIGAWWLGALTITGFFAFGIGIVRIFWGKPFPTWMAL